MGWLNPESPPRCTSIIMTLFNPYRSVLLESLLTNKVKPYELIIYDSLTKTSDTIAFPKQDYFQLQRLTNQYFFIKND